MLVVSFSFLQYVKWLRFFTLAWWGISILLGSGFMGIAILEVYNSHPSNKQEIKEKTVEKIPFKEEGLPFKGSIGNFYAEDLQKGLVVFSGNTRPDVKEETSQRLMGFKKDQEFYEVKQGASFYLAYDKGELSISKIPTALQMKVLQVDPQMLQLEVDWQGKKSLYCLDYLLQEGGKREDLQEEFLIFDQVKWWRPDQLYALYGGKEYGKFKGLERLEFGGGLCLIKERDLCVFEEGRWREVAPSEATQNYPLAEVTKVDKQSMSIRVWDKTGRFMWEFTLVPEKQEPLFTKPEEVFSQIKLRGLNQITCKIEAKTYLLKQGDWLLKTAQGWKVLRTWDEVERYLQYRLPGELFVFDGVEKKQGKAVFKGHLFDTMRVRPQEVVLPIVTPIRKSGLRRGPSMPRPLRQEGEKEEELLRLNKPK